LGGKLLRGKCFFPPSAAPVVLSVV